MCQINVELIQQIYLNYIWMPIVKMFLMQLCLIIKHTRKALILIWSYQCALNERRYIQLGDNIVLV